MAGRILLDDNGYRLTDPWEGLGVYRSVDAREWKRCGNILDRPGIRKDDGAIGCHADVLVHKGRAYIFYFTHPEVGMEERNAPEFLREYRHRRSSLQVAELKVSNSGLVCDRNHVEIDLEP